MSEHEDERSGEPEQPVGVPEEPTNSQLWELGYRAVWSLSSAKPTNGVAQLRDNDLTTYWQSDGAQPHVVTIQFNKKTSVQHVLLFLDFQQDESYTPHKVSLRTGTTLDNMQVVMNFSLVEPSGWVTLPVKEDKTPLRTFIVQVVVTQNHQIGRDVHIRQIKIYGPRDSPAPTFSTTRFNALACVR